MTNTINTLAVCRTLSLACRFGGNVRWFSSASPRHYSVAEHTVHMVRKIRSDGYGVQHQRAAWLHDVPEFITGDQLPIVKKDPDAAPHIRRIETTAMCDICHALDVPYDEGVAALTDPVVKQYDAAILAAEAIEVATPQPGWKPYDKSDPIQAHFRNQIYRAHSKCTNSNYWVRAMMSEFEVLFDAS